MKVGDTLRAIADDIATTPEEKEEIRLRLHDLSHLLMQQAGGVDSQEEIDHVVAQIEMRAGAKAQQAKNSIRMAVSEWGDFVLGRLLARL